MSSTSTAAPHAREDRSASAYRRRWSWEEVFFGSHCVDCYPGGCSYRVYVRDGAIYHEEVAGNFGPRAEGIPDFNPMGCNKGAAWSRQLVNEDRVTHPMRRVGPRGSGSWERISWDEAYAVWAGAILDAVEHDGIDTVVHEGTPQKSTVMPTLRFMETLGGTVVDLLGQTNDFNVGMHLTFGKFNLASSIDDWFLSELALVWFLNPSFTRIPHAHYIFEARYRGAEIVEIAPDYNASAMHADTFVPVEPGSDAALALAMCQVIVEEDLLDADFVTAQTDLALVARADDGRFLRQSDLETAGSAEVFFHLSGDGGVREASRTTLIFEERPPLSGSCEVRLRDGSTVMVSTVFDMLRNHLDAAYTPEQATRSCGVAPAVIRDLARKVASRRTNILFGAAASKYYHGDLIERSLCLLLALTGNWGKHGTGIRAWNAGMVDGQVALTVKPFPGEAGSRIVLDVVLASAQAASAADPTLTPEEAARSALQVNPQMPPFMFWYNHCGYGERWDEPGWGDAGPAGSFENRIAEARDAGWWDGLDRLPPERPPRVLVDCGGNTLRRTRGGRRMMLERLWPQLDLVVSIDHRLSATAMHADLVLPAAQHYEKCDYHIPSPHTLNLVFSDCAQPPAGESRNEWDVYAGLLRVLAERAEARGLDEYTDSRGVRRRFAELWNAFTLGGELCDQELRAGGLAEASAMAGVLAEGSDLSTMRRDGHGPLTGWGVTPWGIGEASPFPEDEPHVSLRNHVEQGATYPTLTRRAQFLIDHPWFMEAGEHLPVHKDPPAMGGDQPLRLTSGHCRWSIHRMNIAQIDLLQTHRGQPHAAVNPADAEARGVGDHEWIDVFNDVGCFTVRSKISPSVRPGQVVVYNGWESHQFPGWVAPNEVAPGMVKWLHLAGDYGHLRYMLWSWQPAMVDRATRVDFRVAADSP